MGGKYKNATRNHFNIIQGFKHGITLINKNVIPWYKFTCTIGNIDISLIINWNRYWSLPIHPSMFSRYYYSFYCWDITCWPYCLMYFFVFFSRQEKLNFCQNEKYHYFCLIVIDWKHSLIVVFQSRSVPVICACNIRWELFIL